MRTLLKSSVFCFAAMLLPVAVSASTSGVIGDVRIQFLSPTLVRLEQRGPKGFEDRTTFTVVKRPRPRADIEAEGKSLRFRDLEVQVRDRHSLKGTVIKLKGRAVYECDGTSPPPAFFPAPGAMPPTIAIADNPRIISPKWGATAAPKNSRTHKDSSGWDLSNQALDIYVFLPSSYEQFRKEFLALTGPTEMPPLYAFGLWHSRYHPYTDQEALGVIDRYRKEDIPLDGFVVDTDWRVGASHGYATNAKLFPDMKRFIDEAHKRNVRLMYNDHPEPVSEVALDPKEMNYREEGLASLLRMGVDVWWYDRNWHTTLREPAPGLRKEVWGAAVFHDVTQKVNPELRPLIMSNVPGIDNGRRHYAPHPAAHRFPLWWTGDTTGNFDFLRNGVANAVDGGVESLLPYMSEDLGGHFGNPSPEVYARFIQYGALSPMMRLHCTAGETRDPWAFGEEAESIVRDYAKLRYRLLPTIYSAARRNYEDGTPIVRRCDLEWPKEKEAARNDQYLLGDDILIAPFLTSMMPASTLIPRDLLRTPKGEQGLLGEYFDNKDLAGKPILTRIDREIAFEWQEGSPEPKLSADKFSVRWSGKVGPILTAGNYQFFTVSDDGVRLWVDGKLVIDKFVDMDHGNNRGVIYLDAGKTYDLRVEYYESGGQAAMYLGWVLPIGQEPVYSKREVWIPPGQWMDLWGGGYVTGPKIMEVSGVLSVTPMWQRAGGAVLLAPDMQFTGENPWDEIMIQACVPENGSTTRVLYEDDGTTNEYKKSKFTKSTVKMIRNGEEIHIKISPAKGDFKGRPKQRKWHVRFFFPGTIETAHIYVDGKYRDTWEYQDRNLPPAGYPGDQTFPFFEDGWDWLGSVVDAESSIKPTSEGCEFRILIPKK